MSSFRLRILVPLEKLYLKNFELLRFGICKIDALSFKENFEVYVFKNKDIAALSLKRIKTVSKGLTKASIYKKVMGL